MHGNAEKSSNFLQPKTEMKNPKEMQPNRAPRQLTDPIYEISSFVNFPDTRGVFSDAKIGKAGDTQPTINPYPIINKLAV